MVDLTGLVDTEHQACPCGSTLGRWARTQLLTLMCYETMVAMQANDTPPSAFEAAVDVRLNGFVTGRNYEVVSQAFLLLRHCPLKLRFVGFRADSLALKQLFYVLRLAEPESMRKLEVRIIYVLFVMRFSCTQRTVTKTKKYSSPWAHYAPGL